MSFDSLEPIEVSNGPDPEIIYDAIEFVSDADEEYFVGGEKFFPSLKDDLGLKLLETVAIRKPEEGDSFYTNEDECDDLNAVFLIKVEASKDLYKDNSKETLDKLQENILKWFVQDHTEYMTLKYFKVDNVQSDYLLVSFKVLNDFHTLREFWGDVIDSSFHERVWNKKMNKVIKEGVCYSKDKVPASLTASLRKHIDELATKTDVDYHPNSKDIVRDLVHPALYPYIKGVSALNKKRSCKQEVDDQKEDFWGRKYEDSKFQWLPTPFIIKKNGKCIIHKYINNLDRSKFPELYNDLESLFELFLPYFQEVWSYAKAMEFFTDDEQTDEVEDIPPIKKVPVSFLNTELQIITKIVEYKLDVGQVYEGVWHAEGMSHENIVMTGIYFIDRDESLQGGSLKFKRGFTVDERNKVFYNVSQTRPIVFEDFAYEGFLPLGHFPTDEGSMLVFPNSHIHKLSKMINNSRSPVSRRIVVFFFINPDKKIISTRDVDPQQDKISLSVAKQYRLELMAERKYNKDKLNVRDIELCEH